MTSTCKLAPLFRLTGTVCLAVDRAVRARLNKGQRSSCFKITNVTCAKSGALLLGKVLVVPICGLILWDRLSPVKKTLFSNKCVLS